MGDMVHYPFALSCSAARPGAAAGVAASGGGGRRSQSARFYLVLHYFQLHCTVLIYWVTAGGCGARGTARAGRCTSAPTAATSTSTRARCSGTSSTSAASSPASSAPTACTAPTRSTTCCCTSATCTRTCPSAWTWWPSDPQQRGAAGRRRRVELADEDINNYLNLLELLPLSYQHYILCQTSNSIKLLIKVFMREMQSALTFIVQNLYNTRLYSLYRYIIKLIGTPRLPTYVLF